MHRLSVVQCLFLKLLLADSCFICGKSAQRWCAECMTEVQQFENPVYFCLGCSESIHGRPHRIGHKVEMAQARLEPPFSMRFATKSITDAVCTPHSAWDLQRNLSLMHHLLFHMPNGCQWLHTPINAAIGTGLKCMVWGCITLYTASNFCVVCCTHQIRACVL